MPLLYPILNLSWCPCRDLLLLKKGCWQNVMPKLNSLKIKSFKEVFGKGIQIEKVVDASKIAHI